MLKIKACIYLILLFGFISCAEKPKQKRQSTDSLNSVGHIDIDADIIVFENVPMTESSKELLAISDNNFTYSISNAPSWLTVNSSTGALSGTPVNRPLDGLENVSITATSTVDSSTVQKDFSIGIYGDPLRTHQWHLKNTGQKTFAKTAGFANFDINVFPAYASIIFGKDIRIAISDSGLETTHEDIMLNALTGEHRDYSLEDAPYIGDPVTTSFHGTAVAGIIAARGWNNIGLTGVAPYAKIAGFQFLDSPQNEDLLIDQASGNFDIFNYSYGDETYSDEISNPNYIDHLRSMSLNGRDGLGSLFVKAAGNEFIVTDDFENPTICVSHNANLPLENEIPFMIVVGAINADGKKASYSNAGSNLWVVAPGGEFGVNEPAILTTDLQSCFKGISNAADPINAFEYDHVLNTKCNYTSAMNGTSSATPVVSGVIALILEANPALTWRDVKHILAMSATKVDLQTEAFPAGKNHPSSSFGSDGCNDLSLLEHEYELGWVTNNAGVSFNNFYGFGLVNVEEAILMANDFDRDPLHMLPLAAFTETNPDFINPSFQRTGLNISIPSNDSNGNTDTLNIVGTNLKVETVQIQVTVTHQRSGELGVELTSPRGTRSILLNINNSLLLGDDANLNVVLATHAFYGEDADGTWEIKVIDGSDVNSLDGSLTSWKINILGH